MGLSARVYARTEATYSGAPDIGKASYEIGGGQAVAMELRTGTANGQADLLFTDTRTIAADGDETLDLAGGLDDVFGNTLTFADVAVIEVHASADNTNDVVIGGAASNAFVGPFGAADNTIAVQPGASVIIATPAAGWPVTAGTGDLLQVANGGSGTGVTYDIVILGRSA